MFRFDIHVLAPAWSWVAWHFASVFSLVSINVALDIIEEKKSE